VTVPEIETKLTFSLTVSKGICDP